MIICFIADTKLFSCYKSLQNGWPGRVINSILTKDSRSDKEDSEKESHVESTITTGNNQKRTAGNMAVHDVRNRSMYSGAPKRGQQYFLSKLFKNPD